MNRFTVDDAARSAINRVLEHSHKSENAYYPYKSRVVPGDDPGHVAVIGDLVCVYSVTCMGGKSYRQLSMSLKSSREDPPPSCFFMTAAALFGFNPELGPTRPVVVKQQGRVVVLAQRLAPEDFS